MQLANLNLFVYIEVTEINHKNSRHLIKSLLRLIPTSKTITVALSSPITRNIFRLVGRIAADSDDCREIGPLGGPGGRPAGRTDRCSAGLMSSERDLNVLACPQRRGIRICYSRRYRLPGSRLGGQGGMQMGKKIASVSRWVDFLQGC